MRKTICLLLVFTMVVFIASCANKDSTPTIADGYVWRICKAYDADFDVDGWLKSQNAIETSSDENSTLESAALEILHPTTTESQLEYIGASDMFAVRKGVPGTPECATAFVYTLESPQKDIGEWLYKTASSVSARHIYCSTVVFNNVCFFGSGGKNVQELIISILDYAGLPQGESEKLNPKQSTASRIDKDVSLDSVIRQIKNLGYDVYGDTTDDYLFVSSDGHTILNMYYTEDTSEESVVAFMSDMAEQNEYCDIMYSYNNGNGIVLVSNTGIAERFWESIKE